MSTGPTPPGSIGRWAIWIVGVVAIVGIVYVMLGVAGVTIPGFIINILWICVAAAIVIGAIYFVMRLTGS